MKFLLTIAVAATMSTSAMAADIPYDATSAPASASYWDGFYLGIVGGGGAFSSSTTDMAGYIVPPSEGTFTRTEMGESLGATAGYNATFGNAVIGLEGDINWANFDNSAGVVLGGDVVDRPSWDWFGTIRARAGVSVGRGLVYATAGAVAADAHYFYGSLTNGPLYGQEAGFDGVVWGMAVGGGVEYALTDNLSAKLEYLDLVLPTTRAFLADGSGSEIDFVSSAQVARVGLNYKF